MAAAVELVDHGVAVDVFEASRTLGGRARRVQMEGLDLDNGTHIMIGAYREMQRLLARVGVPDSALLRLPLQLHIPGHLHLRAPALPAPLHLAWALLGARGLNGSEKFAAMRFMQKQQQAGFQRTPDITVAALLAEQPPALRHRLWEPLCLAALNTSPEAASARIFLNVLRDSLAAHRAASDLLLPTTDFSSLFPEPAARHVEQRGGRIFRGTRIECIHRADAGTGAPAGFQLDHHGTYDQLILAVAPQHLPALISKLPELAPTAALLQAYLWEPIVSCYLAYPDSVRLPHAMIGILDGTAQWLFDRGPTHGQPGLIAAVISASRRHRHSDAPSLATAIHGEIAALVPALPPARWTRVIAEQRATFACTPELQRPPTTTALPGLYLAGDYVASDYPATLESAVRSGTSAAQAACRHQDPSHQH